MGLNVRKTCVCASLIIGLPWLATAAAEDVNSAIGRKVDDFALVDVHGQTRSMADLPQGELVVVAFMGLECPLAKLYAP